MTPELGTPSVAVQTERPLVESTVVHTTTWPATATFPKVTPLFALKAPRVIWVPPVIDTSRMPSDRSIQKRWVPSVVMAPRAPAGPPVSTSLCVVLVTSHDWQRPEVQVPDRQLCPQPPQLFTSICGSTHAPPQLV